MRAVGWFVLQLLQILICVRQDNFRGDRQAFQVPLSSFAPVATLRSATSAKLSYSTLSALS